jgi:hypothetical protein
MTSTPPHACTLDTHSNVCAILAAQPEELFAMVYENPKPPPLMVTDILRIAQDVLSEHITRIERSGAPVVAPELQHAIELAKEIIKTRNGAPAEPTSLAR